MVCLSLGRGTRVQVLFCSRASNSSCMAFAIQNVSQLDGRIEIHRRKRFCDESSIRFCQFGMRDVGLNWIVSDIETLVIFEIRGWVGGPRGSPKRGDSEVLSGFWWTTSNWNWEGSFWVSVRNSCWGDSYNWLRGGSSIIESC